MQSGETDVAARGLPEVSFFPHYVNREVAKLYGIVDTTSATGLLQKSLLITRYAVAFSQGPLVLPASYLFEVPIIDSLLRRLAPLAGLGQVQIASPVSDLEKYAEKKAPEYRDGPDLFGYDAPASKRVDAFAKLVWRQRVKYSSSAEIATAWRHALVTSGGLWNEILRSAAAKRETPPLKAESEILAVPDRLDGRAFIADFAVPIVPVRLDDRDRTRVNLLINKAYLLSYLMEFDASIIIDTPLGPLDCEMRHETRPIGQPPIVVAFPRLKQTLTMVGLNVFCETCEWERLVELRWDGTFSRFARFVTSAKNAEIDLLAQAIAACGLTATLASRPWPITKSQDVKDILLRLEPTISALTTDLHDKAETAPSSILSGKTMRRPSSAAEIGSLFGTYEQSNGIPKNADVTLRVSIRESGLRKRLLLEFLKRQYGGTVDMQRQLGGARTGLLRGCQLRRLVDDLETGEFDRATHKFGIQRGDEAMVEKECYFESMPPVTFLPVIVKSVDRELMEKLAPAIEVLLVTTTDIERDALLSEMNPLPGQPDVVMGSLSDQVYRFGKLGCHAVAIVQTTMGSQGPHGSGLEVYHPIKELKLKAIIAIGIAFGVDRSKLRCGDVMVASSIQPYELAKMTHKIAHRSNAIPCGEILLEAFRNRTADWKRMRALTPVAVQRGLLLSGEKVVNNKLFRDELVSAFPLAIGGEMEGTGIYAAANRGKVEAIIVKAVCDWADGHKNDAAQPFAAQSAVSLVLHVLRQDGALEPLGIRSITTSSSD